VLTCNNPVCHEEGQKDNPQPIHISLSLLSKFGGFIFLRIISGREKRAIEKVGWIYKR